MNVTELQAGRELDALIAERVLGISPSLIHIKSAGEWITYQGEVYFIGAVAHYSTAVSAAFDVVHHLIRTGARFDVGYGALYSPHAQWNATFYLGDRPPGYANGSGDTPALAICRAALATLAE